MTLTKIMKDVLVVLYDINENNETCFRCILRTFYVANKIKKNVLVIVYDINRIMH
jgi:hypothetical protein